MQWPGPIATIDPSNLGLTWGGCVLFNEPSGLVGDRSLEYREAGEPHGGGRDQGLGSRTARRSGNLRLPSGQSFIRSAPMKLTVAAAADGEAWRRSMCAYRPAIWGEEERESCQW
jgi:hypothetical protein